ncbi:MAG TPA: sugar phosphate isomerase/epimerase family protein [Gemmataceae bacterium]|jgi:hexulose-6-phosphate isomerase|nr:sugar phosphate isomerase/epimerase family protein [Gemmataceae bacterium]
MKKSIMRATLPPSPQPLVKNLDAIKKAGFDGIQLGVGSDELKLHTPKDGVTALAKACRDAGLEPHSIYGGISFFHAEEAQRKQELEHADHVLEIASLLGAKTILIHPGQLTRDIPYDACWRYAVDGLRALKGKAEASHLRLGLENVWNKFLMSPLEAQRLLHEVDSPHVGIWFDVGNVTVFGFAEQWLRILGGKRIVGLHIKDFRRGPNDHFGTYEGFVPLFHGSVNWPAVMREIADLGVGDWLITEVSPGSQPYSHALREIARQLDVLISLAKDGNHPNKG